MKKNIKSWGKNLYKMERNNLPDKELKVMVIKMFTNLGERWNKYIDVLIFLNTFICIPDTHYSIT